MKEDYTSNIVHFKKNEREILNILFPKTKIDLHYTPTFERWDAINERQRLILEVKVRGFDYTFFANAYGGDYLIEEDKYFALLNQAQILSGYSPVYVFAFTNYIKGEIEWENCQINGWCAINLGLIDSDDLIKCKRWCPENTINPNSKKVLKDCYLIPAKVLDNYNSKLKLLPDGKYFN